MPHFFRFLPSAVLACALGAAMPAYAVEASQLDAQLKRLAGLLGDSYATAYPELAQVQTIEGPHGRKLAIALFTIESYGGGNNHRQHLAVFEEENDESGPRNHFMLRDVVLIGAKGWRAIRELKAQARVDEAAGKTTLLIPALANMPTDALNFPSRKTTITLEIGRNGRDLQEYNREAP